MKIIEQASVIADLIETAHAIRDLLGERYTLGVTDTGTAIVAIADTDGDGGWIGVTLTGTPELVTGPERTPTRDTKPVEPCSKGWTHPRHKFMRGRYAFQCPGVETPAP